VARAPARLILGLAVVLLLARAAGAAAARAPDDALRAEGQCREGQMQGGYALRSTQGRLRAQGAYNLGQRVGSFIFWNDAGGRIAHVPFDADLVNGTLSLWYDAVSGEEGAHRLEAAYRRGERHGASRAWYPSGQLRLEAEYTDGVLQSARAWTDTGKAYAPEEARTAADEERETDAQFVDALVALVRRHPPDCSAPPPAQLRADSAIDIMRNA
jgi:hypothetical protein